MVPAEIEVPCLPAEGLTSLRAPWLCGDCILWILWQCGKRVTTRRHPHSSLKSLSTAAEFQ